MIKSFIIILFTMNCAYASDGSHLLIGDSSAEFKNLATKRSLQKLELDNTFLVQAYGAFRALGIKNQKTLGYFDQFFAKDYISALESLEQISLSTTELARLINATKMYSYLELNQPQAFFNLWVSEATKFDFLNTELGVSLDQIVGKKASRWLIQNAIYIDGEQRTALDKIVNQQSKFNDSVQALRYLRQGDQGMKIFSRLGEGDPLKIKLAETTVLHFAKNGKLGHAGKIIKDVLEPVLEKSKNTNKLAKYYLLLARLLYQAKAYDAAKEYYLRIPDESKHFLQARTELLWVSLRKDDYSEILGQVKSLEMKAFVDHDLPEVFLMQAMANLKLCQFKSVEKSFAHFVKRNKTYAVEIEHNLASSDPKQLDEDNFYVNQLNRFLVRRIEETERLSVYTKNENDKLRLVKQLAEVRSKVVHENHLAWKNQQKILEQTIRRMRFVKVEFLSTMRRLKNKLAQMQGQDKISTITSSIDKRDKLIFSHDDVLFGDEVFHLKSKVRKLCLQGKK